MFCETSAHALRLSGRWKAHFTNSDVKTKQNSNISTATVRNKVMLTDTMQFLLSYAEVFKKYYGVRLVNLRITGILKDTMFLKCTATNSGVNYVRYITASRVVIRHLGVQCSSRKLRKEATVVTALRITKFYHSDLYMSSAIGVILITQAMNAFSKNNEDPDRFQANFMYRNSTVHLHTIHLCDLDEEKQYVKTFELFLNIKIRQSKLITQAINYLLISNIHSFDYKARVG